MTDNPQLNERLETLSVLTAVLLIVLLTFGTRDPSVIPVLVFGYFMTVLAADIWIRHQPQH